jgi:tRNA (guanine26-N2/guanine27-N2)-dimethyltransferase
MGCNSHPSSSGAAAQLVEERGCSFTPGGAFYRGESCQGRDMAVLAAAVHRQQTGGPLRVLDLMAGSGGRGKRYLEQVGGMPPPPAAF